MADIIISKIDESQIRVISSDASIVEELYYYFRFEKPGFVKNRYTKWDGVVRLYNKNKGTLPAGLLQIVLKFANERKYKVDIDPKLKNVQHVDDEVLTDWMLGLDLHSKGNPITPYQFQYDIVRDVIKFGRITALAATSAGKSLIAYILSRYILDARENNSHMKTLIVVPSVMLARQMTDDFKDYSSANGWPTAQMVHTITGGEVKYTNKPVVISTWQSIYEESGDYFSQFDSIIVDECHLTQADSLTKICSKSVNATLRLGMTGTLRNDKTGLHPVAVQGNFGPIMRYVTSKQLQDAGLAAKTKVTMMMLQYPDSERIAVGGMDYHKEMEFLHTHPARNNVICKLASFLKGNNLFLFSSIDHLTHIYHSIKEECESAGKQVFIINGEVAPKVRDDIKLYAENNSDVIILATFGTMSTGVSIKRLHNLVLASPTKSIVRVLQSVGRMMRLHESKAVANIIDITDSMKWLDRENYSLKHGRERMGYYKAEQHPINLKPIKF